MAALAFAMASFCALCGAAAAAGNTLSLPQYDCAAAQANHAPTRRLGQYIGGVYYEWREYLSAANNGVPICVQKLVPDSAFLTRREAEAFLTAGLPTPNLPTSESQSNPLGPSLNAPAAPLPRAIRRSPEKQSAIGGIATELSAIANDNRQPVANTTVFPYSNVVYLVAQFPSGNAYRCSGVLATPYVVMTAGHCIQNNQEGGYATTITIVPGQYQSGGTPIRPFGQMAAQGVATTVEWQTISGPQDQLIEDFRYDVATVRLPGPFAGITSFMPVVYDNPAQSATSVGYPAQAGTSSATNYTQWTAQGAITADAANGNYQAQGFNEYQIAVSPGNSGGPYWVTDNLGRQLLVGITSYGDDTTGVSGGPYYGDYNEALVANWLRWTPTTPVADPVPASNLTFATAIAIAGQNGEIQGSNAGAVAENGAPTIAGVGGGRIAWWRWTAPQSGWVTIDTLGSNFDTVLGVYTGTALAQLTAIAQNDDIENGIVQQSRVQFMATAGTVYSIGVDGFNGQSPDNDGGQMGRIVLNWSMQPQGYAFETIPLSGETGQSFALNSTVVPQPAIPPIAGTGGGNVVYFMWTAPRTGYVTVDTLGSDFDTVLGAFTGKAPNTLTTIAQNDDANPPGVTQSRVSFLANGGTNYLLGVDGKGSATGNITLNWAMAPALYPDSGWWYQAALPGAGFAVETSPDPVNGGGRIFFAAYEYDSSGRPIWYASDLSPTAATATAGAWLYSGQLTLYSLDASHNPTGTSIGAMQLSIPSTNAMTLTWPSSVGGQQVSATRYPFNGTSVDPSAIGNAIQTGWWLNPAQPGAGWMIEVQDSTLFLGYFTYRSDGSPVWYFANGPTDGKTFAGTLIQTSGGPNFTQPGAAQLGMISLGAVSMVFSAPNQALVVLPDHSVQSLQRYTTF